MNDEFYKQQLEEYPELISQANQLQLDEYHQKYGTNLQPLASGAYGQVAAIDDHWVLKRARDHVVRGDMLREIGFLTLLRGMPNVITMQDYFFTYLPMIQFNLVLERADYDFAKYMQALHRTEGWSDTKPGFDLICWQLCNAVEQVHRHNILHLDIKPNNFLVMSNNRIKITDFGVSELMTVGCQQVYTETDMYQEDYRPPEMLGSDQPKDWFSTSADIWALGMVMFHSYTGDFNLLDRINVWEFLKDQREYLRQVDNLDLRILLRWMLSEDPLDRPNIYQVLQSRYFQPRNPPEKISCFDQTLNLCVDYGYSKIRTTDFPDIFEELSPKQYHAWRYLMDSLSSITEMPTEPIVAIKTRVGGLTGYIPMIPAEAHEWSAGPEFDMLYMWYNNQIVNPTSQFQQIYLIYLMKGRLVFAIPDDFIRETDNQEIIDQLEEINALQLYVDRNLRDLILDAYNEE